MLDYQPLRSNHENVHPQRAPAAGLVALSLPAHAFGSTTVADTPLVKSNTTQQQLAQRPYDPNADSVGFKKSQQLAQRPYDPSAGSVGLMREKRLLAPHGICARFGFRCRDRVLEPGHS